MSKPIVTIGYFDGLHLGHQKLLGDLKSWSREIGGTPIVITFNHHPQKIISGTAPPTILDLQYKLILLERSGIATTLVLDFNQELSQWSPEKFVEEILIQALECKNLLLGFDSTVGHKRLGTFEYLQTRSDKLGIQVRQSEPLLIEDIRISSTLVRKAVQQGNLAELEKITGRQYAIFGKVVCGDRRGKSIGFPTANLEINTDPIVPGGVYFARANCCFKSHNTTGKRPESGRTFKDRPALVNIGQRPTFNQDQVENRVEVHILDFDEDIYDVHLEVSLLKHYRDEKRFNAVDELVDQIKRDEQAFREWLSGR